MKQVKRHMIVWHQKATAMSLYIHLRVLSQLADIQRLQY